MPMDFPNSPVVGQIFSSGSRSWVWTGTTWDSPTADNPSIAAALAAKQDIVSGVSNTEISYLDGVTSAIQTQLNARALKRVTVRGTTVNTAITAADSGNIVRLTGATARTITIDNVLNEGEGVDFLQDGTGFIQFAAGSGVTLRSVDNKLKTNKQYSGATVRCVASGIYHLIGDLIA